MEKSTQINFDEEFAKPEIRRIMKQGTKKYYNLSEDERHQCGCIALMMAIKRFKPEKSTFPNYLKRYVKWECLNYITQNASNPDILSINENTPVSYSQEWFEVKQDLTQDEERLLVQKFIENKTLRELGAEYGVSITSIMNRINKIKKNIVNRSK